MSPAKRSVVDTNVWIQLFRGDPVTVEFMQKLARRHRIICSVITVAELHAGNRPGLDDKLYWGLRNTLQAQVSPEIARDAGHYRRRYLVSHGSELADCLIAATARAHKADLVTFNTRHFPMTDIHVVMPR